MSDDLDTGAGFRPCNAGAPTDAPITSVNDADAQVQPSNTLDQIESLLRKQIALARQRNITNVEILVRLTSSLVETMAKAGVFESAEYQQRRDELRDLYDTLSLILNSHRSETAEQLGRTRKGKKTVNAYRRSL